MSELVKIRDVSVRYDISARTLRYYEDMGLLSSTRNEDYAYRLFDEAALRRLEQILILRKLNISIKDIQRIFSASGSEVVLEVLRKKVTAIDEEVSLLRELREIVLTFIRQIERIDFTKESDVKLLYEQAKAIETQLVNVDYNGNSSTVSRLLEVTEKLDRKVPDILIIRIPRFRAVTSGVMSFGELFGGDFGPWQEAHSHLFRPVVFDAHDFLLGKDGGAEWLWAVKDGVTAAETDPYGITEYPGGLYAAAVSMDGDGESHDRVRSKTAKWLENTDFTIDNDRELMGHMIYVDDEIQAGLGYHQMVLYAPIKRKDRQNGEVSH
ncbi:MAG: MerR family transcriptional regulator [Oscillospiraceae bacterium]|jgi:DNA-binding transcriptional MerR regulator|nr:MerR family transcriptional regulator [Oscillospiraceae bacterium]